MRWVLFLGQIWALAFTSAWMQPGLITGTILRYTDLQWVSAQLAGTEL